MQAADESAAVAELTYEAAAAHVLLDHADIQPIEGASYGSDAFHVPVPGKIKRDQSSHAVTYHVAGFSDSLHGMLAYLHEIIDVTLIIKHLPLAITYLGSHVVEYRGSAESTVYREYGHPTCSLLGRFRPSPWADPS